MRFDKYELVKSYWFYNVSTLNFFDKNNMTNTHADFVPLLIF